MLVKTLVGLRIFYSSEGTELRWQTQPMDKSGSSRRWETRSLKLVFDICQQNLSKTLLVLAAKAASAEPSKGLGSQLRSAFSPNPRGSVDLHCFICSSGPPKCYQKIKGNPMLTLPNGRSKRCLWVWSVMVGIYTRKSCHFWGALTLSYIPCSK